MDRDPNAGDLADRYVAGIRSDAERMAAALEHGPLDRPVDWCPGWDLRALGMHMGHIHRWARFAVVNGRPPGDDDLAANVATDRKPDDDSDGAELATWLRAGATLLADDLDAADPNAPTWHPFPAERKVSVWKRRQAHEISVHRWDAEATVFGAATIDAPMAADGVAEYLQIGLPRVLAREVVAPPLSPLELRCTDIDSSWVVAAAGDLVDVSPGAGDAGAALAGSAQTLLLVLTGRADPATLEVVGDPAVADEWLSLPGW